MVGWLATGPVSFLPFPKQLYNPACATFLSWVGVLRGEQQHRQPSLQVEGG